jgi:hypothetical protein
MICEIYNRIDDGKKNNEEAQIFLILKGNKFGKKKL